MEMHVEIPPVTGQSPIVRMAVGCFQLGTSKRAETTSRVRAVITNGPYREIARPAQSRHLRRVGEKRPSRRYGTSLQTRHTEYRRLFQPGTRGSRNHRRPCPSHSRTFPLRRGYTSHLFHRWCRTAPLMRGRRHRYSFHWMHKSGQCRRIDRCLRTNRPRSNFRTGSMACSTPHRSRHRRVCRTAGRHLDTSVRTPSLDHRRRRSSHRSPNTSPKRQECTRLPDT